MIFEEKNEGRALVDIILSNQEYTGEMNASRDMIGTFDSSTVAGILKYERPPNFHHSSNSIKKLPLFKPILPALKDISFATCFTSKLRSSASTQFPANVPQNVDRRFFFTVGLGTNPCQSNQPAKVPMEPCFKHQSITYHL
ncbi:hypothetical protein WN944_027964 [Citrus x changshan-huyou]|uniref:Uncharacterized protein n=1 Tax=Citrus x changshan-huyou TaxID=2935761 RepID=A0AAP0Q9P1_9ROSI